jgi:hypothetical protein
LNPKNKNEPFDELDLRTQRAAIDICAAVSVIIARLPAIGTDLHILLKDEFGLVYNVGNKGAYALRHVGEQLFSSDWQFIIVKDGNRLSTKFDKKLEGSNGEIVIME